MSMLNDIIFNGLNHALAGNIEYADIDARGYKIQLMTKSKILYKDFIRKTEYLIPRNDIVRYDDSAEEDLTFTLDLTEDLIVKFIHYTKMCCLSQFEDMRRISRF